MNSDFLTMIGLGGVDIGYILVGIAGVLLIFMIILIVLIAKYNKLKKRYDRFMKGKNAASLEENVHGVFEDMKLLKTYVEKNMMRLIIWADSFRFPWRCWMRIMTDLSSIPFTAVRAVILIQRK